MPDLFETVILPEAVWAELHHPETPAPVRLWIASAPTWLVRLPDPSGPDTGLLGIDAGERAALMLAASLRADLILMDDRAAVGIARRRGFAVIGTLGLLDLAPRRGLVDLGEAFGRLKATSFRYRPELLDSLLAYHRASQSS